MQIHPADALLFNMTTTLPSAEQLVKDTRDAIRDTRQELAGRLVRITAKRDRRSAWGLQEERESANSFWIDDPHRGDSTREGRFCSPHFCIAEKHIVIAVQDSDIASGDRFQRYYRIDAVDIESIEVVDELVETTPSRD